MEQKGHQEASELHIYLAAHEQNRKRIREATSPEEMLRTMKSQRRTGAIVVPHTAWCSYWLYNIRGLQCSSPLPFFTLLFAINGPLAYCSLPFFPSLNRAPAGHVLTESHCHCCSFLQRKQAFSFFIPHLSNKLIIPPSHWEVLYLPGLENQATGGQNTQQPGRSGNCTQLV